MKMLMACVVVVSVLGSAAVLRAADGAGALLGFGTGLNWRVNSSGIASAPFANDVLTLSDNGLSQARSAFHVARQPVSNGFVQSFTYVLGGSKIADGATFVIQNDPRGTNALGASGGTLGLGGTTNAISNSVALAMNIYAANVAGVRLYTNAVAIGANLPLTPVVLNSGNPINVTLVHDPVALTLTALFAEQTTTNTKVLVFTNVNVGGSTRSNAAFMGFTGATGGSTCSQLLSGEASFFNNTLGVTSQVVLTSGNKLNLAGNAEAVAALSDGGGAGGVVTNSGLTATALGFAPTNGSVAAFSGTIVDAPTGTNVTSVVMMGAGVQELSGANTFRGGTFVENGTLRVGANSNLGDTNGVLTMGGGVLQVTGSFAFVRSIFMPVGGTFGVATGQTLTINGNTFNSGSAGVLTKTDGGTLALLQPAGFNPWTGSMVINGGVVTISGGGDATIRGAGVTINNGGALKHIGGNCIINTCTITVNAGGLYDMNNLSEAFAYLAGWGVVTNTGGMELDLGAVTNTFSGPISGFGQINLRGANGAGVQVFSGTNTFSGGVRMALGTLSVGEDVNLGVATGAVTFVGGTLRVTGTIITNLDSRPVNWTTFNGGLDIASAANAFMVTNVIAGTGAVTKVGAGSLTLSATNTYSGATTVSSGVLNIAESGALASAVVTVNAGAQLSLASGTALRTNATLNLSSNVAGAARVNLSNGVNQIVAVLNVNGLPVAMGTWGATGSGALFTNDTYFAGAGILTVTTGIAATPSDSSWAVDASGNWNTASNWLGGLIAFGTNAAAYFTNTITADRVVTNLFTALDIGNLVFNSQSNNWTVLGLPLNLAVLAGMPTITVQSNNAIITAVITGSQGLAKSGNGTLSLNTVNAFAGPATVNQGTLQLTGAGSLFNTGAATGTVSVNSGATFQFARSDSFGNHASVPQATVMINAGGLMQNTGAVFNTLKDLTLNGGELRVNNGANATFQAYQLKGTVTVSGAASLISLSGANTNVNHQVQLGDNGTNSLTTLAVPDVTGDGAPDLTVSAAFANGRNAANNANVATGFRKTGAGTLLLSGSSINTGTNSVDASKVIVKAAALNGPVNLTNGAVLVAESGPGLVGEFYNGIGAGTSNHPNFVNPTALGAFLGPVTPNVLHNFPATGTNFDFDAGGIPAGVQSNLYSARWIGKFGATTPGVHTFITSSDDGSFLWVDGTNVVNNNFYQGNTARTGTIDLATGEHDIVIGYFNGGTTGNFWANVVTPGGTTNRINKANVTTGPGLGSLLGDASSSVVLSNTMLTVSQSVAADYPGTISGGGSFRKIGTATLTISGANTATNWIIGGGRLEVAGDANIGGAASALSFGGGFLRIPGTGIANLDSHNVNWPTFAGGFDIASAAHTFTVTQNIGSVAAGSSLWKQGPGTVPMVGNSNVLNAGVIVNNGTLIGQDAAFITQSNIADVVGNVAGDSGWLVLRGNSSFTRASNNLIVGNAAGATGVLTVAGNARVSGPAFSPLIVGNSGRGLLTVQDNGFVSNKLIVGNTAGAVGALHLRGGNVFNSDGSGQDSAFGWNTGAYGYLGVFAGAFTNRGWFWIGGNNGAGVMQQTGGNFNHLGLDGGFDIARGGTGVVHLAGGTFTVTSNNVNLNVNGNNSGLCIMTVTTGSTAVVAAGNVALGNKSNMVAILNLNGGSLRANQVYKQLGVSSNLALVNFDGGTLRANLGGNLFNTGVNAPDQINIYGGGATFDTVTGLVVTIGQALRAPTGTGVTSIAVATPGSGYLGSPIVSITGGGGTGATAFAVVDLDTNSANYGQLTSVLITSPGQSYTGTPTVALQGGGPVVAATLGALTMSAVTSGPVTITGSGSLSLLGTNTYSGGTIISNGILLIGSTNAVGSGPITIAGNTAGIGPAYAIGQDFIIWLTSRTTVASSTALLGIGANSASNLDLTALTNWGITAAGGSYTLNGGVAISGTNLYLGGGVGTLTFVPTIGTGTNLFIGLTGGSATGVVVLAGTNNAYGSTINLRSGILRAGRASAFGSTSSVVNVIGDTTLDIAGQNLGNVNVFAQGLGANGIGAIINSGADQISALQRVTLTGDTRVGGTGRWDVRGAGTYLDLAGFTLTKTNANVLGVVQGTLTDGNLIIGQGTLALHAGVVATGATGRITIRPGATLDFYATPSPIVTMTITNEGGTISSFGVGAGNSSIGSPIGLANTTNTFNIASLNTLTLTGVVSGSGIALKIGTGSLVLTAPETFSGQVVVNAGTVELASDSIAGTTPSAAGITINNGGTVQANFTAAIGPVPVTIMAGGVLGTSNGVGAKITGPLTLSGGILGGALPNPTNGNWMLGFTNVSVVSNSAITAPRIQLGGAITFTVAAGVSLGTGSSFENPPDSNEPSILVKSGPGTMILGAQSTYTGPTVVEAGTLKLQSTLPPVAGMLYWLDAADTSTISAVSGKVTAWNDKSGNARHFTQGAAVMQPTYQPAGVNGRPSIRFDGVTNQLVLNSATAPQTVFIVNRPTQYTVLNGIWGWLGGDKGIRMNNVSAWQQAGGDPNDFTGTNGTGAMYINGILTNVFGALGTPHVLSANRGVSHNNAYVSTSLGWYFSGNPSRVWQGDICEVIVYGTTLSTNDRVQVEQYLMRKWFTGGSVVTNDVLPIATLVKLNSGTTLDLNGVSQTVGALADNGGAGQIANTNGAAVLTLGNGDKSGSFSGVIAGGTNIALVKIGTGTQTLHGVSTFNGDTTLSNGTLLVNGALTGNAFTWLQGGTLGGTGLVAGQIINFATIIAPGESAGTLTFANDYAAAGGTFAIELFGTNSHDRVQVVGSAGLAGTLNVTTNGGFVPAAGNTFTIITAAALNGTFATTNLPALADPNTGWDVAYTNTAVILSVTGAPPAFTGYDLASQSITNPTLRGIQDDADGDGFANLLEYVTGGNLTNADTVARMNAARTNGVLALKFTRDTNTVDATLIVEGSYSATNNAGWIGFATNFAGSWGGSTNVTEGAGSPATVTAFDTAPAATNRFLRLRVTRP